MTEHLKQDLFGFIMIMCMSKTYFTHNHKLILNVVYEIQQINLSVITK